MDHVEKKIEPDFCSKCGMAFDIQCDESGMRFVCSCSRQRWIKQYKKEHQPKRIKWLIKQGE